MSDNMVLRSTTCRALRVTRRVSQEGAKLHLAGGLRLDLHVVGGHKRTDLASHIPPTPRDGGAPGVLQYVDVVLPGWSPPSMLAFAEDVARLRVVHGKLLAFDWEVLRAGHVGCLGT